MLAMALLLLGAVLCGMGGEWGWPDGPGEGAWAPASPLAGFPDGSEDGEPSSPPPSMLVPCLPARG